MKDKEKDLIGNDPSKGSQTDMDTQKSNEDENNSFETIAPQKDNRVRMEFEIGQLGNPELKEDELTKNETVQGAPGNTKPSSVNFNVPRFEAYNKTVIINVFL